MASFFNWLVSLFNRRAYPPVPALAPDLQAAQTAPSSPGDDAHAIPPDGGNAAPATPAQPAPASIPADTPKPAGTPAWLDLCRPLVRHFEGCRLNAYWDANGKVWTCGWGSTGADIRTGTVWTQATADARNDAQLNDAAALVDRAVKVPLQPHQKAALVSIVYNVGPGRAAHGTDPGRQGITTLPNGQPSTLLRSLNAGNLQECASQFLVWNMSGGRVLPGLVTRRAAERQLFMTGAWKP